MTMMKLHIDINTYTIIIIRGRNPRRSIVRSITHMCTNTKHLNSQTEETLWSMWKLLNTTKLSMSQIGRNITKSIICTITAILELSIVIIIGVQDIAPQNIQNTQNIRQATNKRSITINVINITTAVLILPMFMKIMMKPRITWAAVPRVETLFQRAIKTDIIITVMHRRKRDLLVIIICTCHKI